MGVESIMLGGAAQSAQGRQQNVERDTTETKAPIIGVKGRYSSPLAYRIVTRISNSEKLTEGEKGGLVKSIDVVDDFAKVESQRTKMLNSIAAVANYLEKTSADRVSIQASAAKSEESALARVDRMQDQAELQVALKRELERITQKARQESADRAIAEGREGVEEITGHRLDEVVDGLSVGASEEIKELQPMELPGSGGAMAPPVMIIPGQNLASSDVGRLVDIQIPGSGSTGTMDIPAMDLRPTPASLQPIDLPGQMSLDQAAVVREAVQEGDAPAEIAEMLRV